MSCHDHPTPNQKSFEVIVIGSGFAGLAAAIECKMNGGDVIVLEKMKAIGGNSIISDGGIAAPDTIEQRNLGIQDSIDLMYEDMMRSAEGLNDPKITRRVCEEALDAYTWSKDVLNVNYMPRVDIFGGHQVPRCYTPDPLSGSTMILKMKQKCIELGIEIRLGSYVKSIIQEDTGRVSGVELIENYSLNSIEFKNPTKLLASKSLIIASGGFASDKEFLKDILKDDSFLTTNKKSTSSEVIEACMRINAATTLLDQIQWMPWTTQDEIGYGKGGLFGDYIVSSYGILIDCKTGKRFINELGNRKHVAEAIRKTKDVIGVVDETSVVRTGWNLEDAIKKGIIKTHPDLEHLSNHYGIPHDSLKLSISEYSSNIKLKKNDPFGKVIETWMSPIETPPFYTMRIHPKTHYSLGGLVTDIDAHVLDIQGKIIKGLYAAGEVTGLTHGANRLGSCSVTECIVMGRVAGRKAIEN